MLFGKFKKRKSNVVGTPEYNQYEESDNTQDMLDLQERMRKHGFEGGPGINKDRWIYGDDIFDIDRPAGGAVQIWSMKEADYDKLRDLLDKLDADSEGLKEPDDEEFDTTDADSINIADFEDEIKESGGDVNKIVERIIDLSKTTDMSSDDVEYMRDVLTQKVKDYLEDKNNSTDLSSIAKSITANDIGRSL